MSKNETLIINKTWKYLLPCLKGHGEDFVTRFDPIFKLGAFIHNADLDGAEVANGRTIQILFDLRYKEYLVNAFFDFVREKDYYVSQYLPFSESEMHKQAVILKIPEKYYDAYDYFLKGEYSKMYTKEQAKELFGTPLKKSAYDVLTKTPGETFDNFVRKLKGVFYAPEDHRTNDKSQFKEMEWDFPLIKREEILNYREGQGIYFNEQKDKIWKDE